MWLKLIPNYMFVPREKNLWWYLCMEMKIWTLIIVPSHYAIALNSEWHLYVWKMSSNFHTGWYNPADCVPFCKSYKHVPGSHVVVLHRRSICLTVPDKLWFWPKLSLFLDRAFTISSCFFGILHNTPDMVIVLFPFAELSYWCGRQRADISFLPCHS